MGRIAIVGATGTIGTALAERLVASGRQLLLLGRDETRLAELSQRLDQPYATFDLGSSQSLETALASHGEQAGDYASFVNCVGSVLLKPAHLTSDDEFRATVETNLFSSFSVIRCAGRYLRQHGGSVVLFASAAAQIGIQNHEAIAAAKAGVIGLARSAAATYAPHNIRVNVVSPGLVRTRLTRRIWENELAATASANLHALGRLGEPQHIASLAAWLLDPANDWITGQVIAVDGGLSGMQPARRSK